MRKLDVGFDIGSTTAKLVVLEGNERVFERYARHMADARGAAVRMLREAAPLLAGRELRVAVSGSAGIGLSQAAGLFYAQEVFAEAETVRALAPDTDAAVELGGEDAKIIFFRGAVDERMNGSCAGGTGAFIDQMADLMGMTPDEFDRASLEGERIYPIASRCGVFAKTDVQPLINQGARKADVAMSIYQAVVNQTVGGLARGRRIEGNVMFLGGPLHYDEGLRRRFVETLSLAPGAARFPEYGRYAVAIGAALLAAKREDACSLESLSAALDRAADAREARETLAPLFANEAEYDAFRARHSRADVAVQDPSTYVGDAYLGVDCGSTTTKLTLIGSEGQLLYSHYEPNGGNPVVAVLRRLREVRALCVGGVRLAGCAATGYGEQLIRNAFRMDTGVVETCAHLRAARRFCPDADFLLDIGGQDIKCFRIKNGAIDSILLNEACSSGCGSFISTFARTMGMEVDAFARAGLFAKNPVNLGSRCTVFMNSSVKQAQKDGATIGDISAGISMSVVSNALYKVIRVSDADELGARVVAQGGTFLNDAVLRAFERQAGREVTRPSIAALMGAYGAALYAMEHSKGESTLLTDEELAAFTHETRSTNCKGCGNRCSVTVNRFSGGRSFVSGNRCERVFRNGEGAAKALPNLYRWKREQLLALRESAGSRGLIGLPLGLNFYELAPFFSEYLRALDFGVAYSGFSDRASYARAQSTIPSDTACYPAKLMHGQTLKLAERGVDAILHPCMTWNLDEKKGQNCFNCPLVAYYAELLADNMDELRGARYLRPYLDINRPRELAREMRNALQPAFGPISKRESERAADAAYRAQREWNAAVRAEGERALAYAREHKLRVMVLAGRPYHVDPLIGHGIDELAEQLGFVVVSEDAVAHLAEPPRVDVLNQWTYHARLYAAARFAAEHRGVELVQLVSFGCGLDAITSDEVRAILERAGKLYTQLKIDEISNLGAVGIRLRSLMGALEERNEAI